MDEIKTISIIGSGNLATQLALSLHKNGIQINQVFSRKIENASELGAKINANPINLLDLLSENSDLYIIAVSDTILVDLLNKIRVKDKFVVHTAGSISVDIFKDKFTNYGVFYPLQTFSKSRIVNFSEIPICIESNSQENTDLLFNLGQKISTDVRFISSDERKMIHLAAVFTCNFANHMFAIGNEILEKSNIDSSILKPLLKETAQKAFETDAKQMQTGPALRNDENVMNTHKEMLANSPLFKKIYSFVSKSILFIND